MQYIIESKCIIGTILVKQTKNTGINEAKFKKFQEFPKTEFGGKVEIELRNAPGAF